MIQRSSTGWTMGPAVVPARSVGIGMAAS
jgi:hypothetical protein